MQGQAVQRRALALPLAVILLASGLIVARAQLSRGDTAGTISTYLGGAGCPASPTISFAVNPRAVVADGAGNLYVGEPNGILRVDKNSKQVTQVPGTFDKVQELGMDGAGNLYVLEGPDTGTGTVGPPRGVKRVAKDGNVTQVVAPIGDNAVTVGPVAMAVANDGTIYLGAGSRVISVSPAGVEAWVANQAGTPGSQGDGGPAVAARLNTVSGLAVDAAGNLYIADKPEGRVRRVEGGVGAGAISTVAGGNPFHEGSYPVAAGADFVTGETMAANGANLMIVEADRHQVVKLTGQTLDLAAGNGGSSDGCSGDGGPARQAELSLGQGFRSGADVDPTTGDLYIADDGNNGVRRVAAAGTASPNGRGTGWGSTTTPTTSPTTAPTTSPTTAPPTTAPPTTIDPTPPTANFDFTSGRMVGEPVAFTDTSTGASSWSWTFGDGSSSTQQHPVHIYSTSGAKSVKLTVTKSNGQTASLVRTVAIAPAETGGNPGYEPLSPVRAVDTRTNVGMLNGPKRITGNTSIQVDVAGPLGRPASEVAGGAVVLNLTGINPTVLTYLQVYPSGEVRPNSSNVNLVPGQTLPNLVISKIGADGKVTIFNAAGAVDVAGDVMGYFPPGSGYEPKTPVRVLDTRTGAGVPVGRVGAQQSVVLDLPADLPSTGSVVLNVTAINPTDTSYLSVYPAAGQQPWVSNLNFAPGETIANLVVVKLDAAGQARLFNAVGSVDIAVDYMGSISEGGMFHGLTPERIYDSRVAGGPLGPGQTRQVKVQDIASVPSGTGVKAVVVNVTAVNVTAATYLTVFPEGAAPGASNLNLVPGDIVPNLVIAKVGADGTVSIFNAAGSVDVIVDVTGYIL